jgi:uroporphyrinogen III methyltransferase/synthase
VFVGAGPGAHDLLTVRAVACLREADVIVHDRLVPDELFAAVATTAERIPAPAPPAGTDRGTAVGQLLVELAARGRVVVRLKGGDSGIFSRLEEELEPLQAMGIAVEFVPGVTAALAAAAAAGVPLTSREAASSLTLVTGHDADGKSPALDFRRLASVPGTIAVYMGVEQAAHWSEALVAGGLDPATPVTIVGQCSWPDERIAASTLARCATDLAAGGWLPPAVLLVGQACRTAPSGPLANAGVLVTRPAGQADGLAALVRAAGGRCVHVPLVTIAPPASWEPLDEAIARADTFDWIVFASVNGVRGFVQRLRAAGRDGRALGTARLAVIGPATRDALESSGLVADLAPDDFRSEGLVEVLADGRPGSRFLLVRADRGRELLRQTLEARGHVVEEVTAYRSVPVERLDERRLAAVDAAGIEWVTVTSSRIAETAVRLFGPRMRRWRIASLSPVTTATLRRHGLEPAVEAREATMAGLVTAMVSSAGRVESAGGAPAARNA